jgi:hypothetical protein
VKVARGPSRGIPIPQGTPACDSRSIARYYVNSSARASIRGILYAMETKLLLALVLSLVAACASFPQVPEIPKEATDAVDNAAVFAATIQPVKETCSKPNALPEFCTPFLVAEARFSRSIVEAKRLLVAGQSAQTALSEVRAAMLAVMAALTQPGEDVDADAGSP